MSAPRPCPHCGGNGWDAGEPPSEVEIAGRRLDQYSWPEIDTMVVSLMDRLRVAQQSPDDEHPTMVSDAATPIDEIEVPPVEWPTEVLQDGLRWIVAIESGETTYSWPGDAALYAIAALLRREIERRG